MAKKRCKQLWQGIGVATPGFTTLTPRTDWQGVIDRLGKVFVKPASEGSSLGMSTADTAITLQQAYVMANAYSGEVLAEQFIEGAEYTLFSIMCLTALPPPPPTPITLITAFDGILSISSNMVLLPVF